MLRKNIINHDLDNKHLSYALKYPTIISCIVGSVKYFEHNP